jgi:CheY-like chemotaxis protein
MACAVLVVDDDPDIVATVVDILQFEGYATQTARNGAEALEVVEQSRPNVVLLDMRMPVLDGWGFAREVQRRCLAVRILVMTAAQDARAWAAEIHADGYVPKPFDLPQLLHEVERLCEVP